MPSEKFIGQNVVGPSNIRPQSITVLNFTPNTFDSSSLEIVNGRVSVRAGATELGGQMVNVLSDASSANSIVLNSVVQAALTGSGWGGESPLELFTSSGTFFYYGTQLTNYYAASGNRIQFRYGGTYDINVHVSVLAGQDDTSGARAFGLSLDTNGTSAWNTVVDGTHRGQRSPYQSGGRPPGDTLVSCSQPPSPRETTSSSRHGRRGRVRAASTTP